MSAPESPREGRAARRARPRQSLKMQAIGFLSRREHSRQELRAKLLDVLRKRAREEAALAAAAERAAEEMARALREQTPNGIDDAFAPRAPARASPSRASAVAHDADGDIDDDVDGGDGGGGDGGGRRAIPTFDEAPDQTAPSRRGSAARTLIDTLTLASGAALPARLRANLAATIGRASPERPAPASARDAMPEAGGDAPEADGELERTDPEAAVEHLLDWLVANKYLSDARFVESRVSARSRKQGTLRIKLELSRHGLALEPGQAAALRETEFARAQALWQRKFGAVAVEARERAKQARFLASRGFAADVVRRVVGGEEEF